MKLSYPPDIRPTSSRVCEAVFDVLRARLDTFEDLIGLDLFAGGGTLGLKLIELGGAQLTVADISPKSLYHLRKNATRQGCLHKIEFLCKDVFAKCNWSLKKYNLVFADPPYSIDNRRLTELFALMADLTAYEGWIVLEVSARAQFDLNPGEFKHIFNKRYGDTLLWFAMPKFS